MIWDAVILSDIWKSLLYYVLWLIWPTVILVHLLQTWMALADVFAVEVFEPIICLPFCYKEMIIL